MLNSETWAVGHTVGKAALCKGGENVLCIKHMLEPVNPLSSF